ncbi:hypothetical protein CP49_26820 [Bradyrhizobium valentinum]|uniref:Uncharacterized protein n=1 Tax=Bradyrhizobium valentinum TaxID=1518501 RepID=A0A0R3LN33_9BRAD|nr:hypothetical protein CP49_26820 [Bradyrhizobium valentinum]
MAINKPVGDNARKGAVKKRSQVKTKLGGETAWTKRSRKSGEFMALKKLAKKKSGARKFKGVRVEKKAGKKARAGGRR